MTHFPRSLPTHSVQSVVFSQFRIDQSLSLEKEMATHPSVLAWKNPMDGEGQWSIVHRVAKSDTTEWLSVHATANDTENLLKYLLVISISSWLRRLFISFAHFLIVSFVMPRCHVSPLTFRHIF